MATSTAKILGQSRPTANSLTDLYSTPGATQTQASIFVCQQNTASPSLIRIALRGGGVAIDPKHYICYDFVLDPNGTANFTSICLGAGDIVSVQSNDGNVSFSMVGLEIA
jgi:hypothetical protein